MKKIFKCVSDTDFFATAAPYPGGGSHPYPHHHPAITAIFAILQGDLVLYKVTVQALSGLPPH